MLKNQKNRMGKINTMLAAAVICTVAMTGCSAVSAQETTTQQNVNQSDTVLLNTVSNTQGSALREKMLERFADGELPTDENGEIDRSQMRGRGGRNFFTGQTNTFGQDREQQDA